MCLYGCGYIWFFNGFKYKIYQKKKNLTVQRTLNEKQSNMQLYNLHNIHKKFVVLIFVIIFPLVMC